ncbi:flagellar motor protein MotD [Methylomicrobium sp. Wu6]|uniref:flagellar motor protein MotD n=1 Tax=Methylomicrobium sp. Wu6 TaxID=3107928 RepID=UPI002DD63A5E|nr:flagellar motor protein MotD [Methylomicrobium sp. Wu6]MEC4747476.1 flagellar motor protein MotD [Methylomicrobium sp. Wu6]
MKRRRRRIPSETVNHDRWLISYADFVTLLFAFFVVMYAISAVNENKYRAFSKSLERAFIEKKRQVSQLEDALSDSDNSANPGNTDGNWAADSRQLQYTSEQLSKMLEGLISENLVSVKKGKYWIELQMNSELLFLSGSAELAKTSLPLLKKVAEVLKPLPNQINVEGHTDNMPIDTLKFPSNWELSSSRATTVVREFINNGIAPPRLSAIGYGEFHPIADNRIEEGRFKNRRVVLLIITQGYARHRLLEGTAQITEKPIQDSALPSH